MPGGGGGGLGVRADQHQALLRDLPRGGGQQPAQGGGRHCLYCFQDGNLVASHPGVVHTFEKDKFCLVYLQVHIVNITNRDTLAAREIL